jgi:hypothetical protein
MFLRTVIFPSGDKGFTLTLYKYKEDVPHTLIVRVWGTSVSVGSGQLFRVLDDVKDLRGGKLRVAIV